jgi:capsular polysaccharide biosynthesis protein
MNDEIKLEDLKLSIIALWKHKMVIMVTGILVFLIGMLLTLNTQIYNLYSASATVYSAFYGSYEQSVDGATAMISYADLVTSKKVCDRAAAIIGNSQITSEMIQEMINVSYTNSSVIMSISAYSSEPTKAVEVVNAVAEAFVFEIRTITGSDAIQLLDTANDYGMYQNGLRDLWLKRLLAAAAGFMLATGYFFIKELTSTKLRSIEQCLINENDNLLGLIPFVE